MDKIRTIISKEWAEVFKNRLVLFSVIFLPLLLVALPLVTLAITNGLDGGQINGGDEIPVAAALCEGLGEAECMEVYLLDLFALLFMILPVSIPVSIAAYSVVGEKSTHSLEPLLATPITTTELLAGKMLAAIIPAVVATWIAFLIYLIGVRFMVNSAVFSRVIDPLWLVAIFIVGPLLTVLSVCSAMMISSRVSDPRAAEQIASVVILPIILIVVGQSAGLLIIDRQLVILGAIVVFLIDILLVFLTINLFQRETILTRWK
ncbi:MAG TPA: ABC transporter permease subunit [Patescibacteria group bacterium]|nr:ABC transporter permease subunit [Patescibacteria group bacterium]